MTLRLIALFRTRKTTDSITTPIRKLYLNSPGRRQNISVISTLTRKSFSTIVFTHSRKNKALYQFHLFSPVLFLNSSVMASQTQKRPSSDLAAFREHFGKCKHLVVLTGAGMSAESGVPTFRGAGGFWRKWQAQELATPEAFESNPSLVWEFYHYRREVMLSKSPNKGHMAVAECEKRLLKQGRRVVVITQNIDELHAKSGSNNIIELHGNLFTTRCLKCGDISKNYDSPICEALRGKGEPTPGTQDAQIPPEKLPRCKKDSCGGLLRPNVVWFGEGLDSDVLMKAHEELEGCDLCLVVGTSSVVYPASMFAPSVAARGIPVAEFNLEETPATQSFGFHFQGPSGENLPMLLLNIPVNQTIDPHLA